MLVTDLEVGVKDHGTRVWRRRSLGAQLGDNLLTPTSFLHIKPLCSGCSTTSFIKTENCGLNHLIKFQPENIWCSRGRKESNMTEWLNTTTNVNQGSSLHILKSPWFYFLFFYFTILYWFCHTLTWIHHRCTRVSNPEPPSHHPPHLLPVHQPQASCILYRT